MIKTLTNLFKQDKEKFVVPKGVQDVIPVAAIFDDGIFKVGKDKYSKTYRHAAGKHRKNELSERQSKEHTLRVIADFLVYLNFQFVAPPL